MSKIQIKVYREFSCPDIFFVNVQLSSKAKAGLNAEKTMAFSRHEELTRVRAHVGITGGACAEYLNRNYGDNIDCEIAARAAIEVFNEQVAKFTEGQNNLTPADVETNHVLN